MKILMGVPGMSLEDVPKVEGVEVLAFDPVANKFDVVHWAPAWNEREPGGFVSTQFDGEYGPMEDDFQEDRATLFWRLE